MLTKISKLQISITRRLLLMSFASEALVIYPFYTIMFAERSHISAAGIGALLAIWQIVTVVADVPTGIIADRFSKKWIITISRLLKTVGFLLWLAFPTFTGYLAGFVVWGIADALNSGAFQAYLYESLPEEDKSTFKHIYSRINAVTMVAFMAAYFGSFAIGPKYSLLLVISIIFCVVSVVLAYSLPAGAVVAKTKEKPKIFRAAFADIAANRQIKEMIIAGVIVAAGASILVEYNALYLKHVDVNVRYISLIIGLSNTLGAVMFWNIAKLDKYISKYLLLPVMLAELIFVASTAGNMGVKIVGMIIVVRTFRLMQVHYESLIQHLAKNKTRATTASIYSFGTKLITAAALFLIGRFAVAGSIVSPLRLTIFVLVGLLLLAEVVFESDKSTPRESS